MLPPIVSKTAKKEGSQSLLRFLARMLFEHVDCRFSRCIINDDDDDDDI